MVRPRKFKAGRLHDAHFHSDGRTAPRADRLVRSQAYVSGPNVTALCWALGHHDQANTCRRRRLRCEGSSREVLVRDLSTYALAPTVTRALPRGLVEPGVCSPELHRPNGGASRAIARPRRFHGWGSAPSRSEARYTRCPITTVRFGAANALIQWAWRVTAKSRRLPRSSAHYFDAHRIWICVACPNCSADLSDASAWHPPHTPSPARRRMGQRDDALPLQPRWPRTLRRLATRLRFTGRCCGIPPITRRQHSPAARRSTSPASLRDVCGGERSRAATARGVVVSQ